MTAAGVLDLPERDPGLPRFALVLGALAVVAAAIVLVRAGPERGAEVPSIDQPAGVNVGPTGAELFAREGCAGCHPTDGPSTPLAPTLAGAPRSARDRLRDPLYTGTAETAEGYLWEAIVDHCRDVRAGYACPDEVVVGLRLSVEEVDRLVDYVVGLGAEEQP